MCKVRKSWDEWPVVLQCFVECTCKWCNSLGKVQLQWKFLSSPSNMLTHQWIPGSSLPNVKAVTQSFSGLPDHDTTSGWTTTLPSCPWDARSTDQGITIIDFGRSTERCRPRHHRCSVVQQHEKKRRHFHGEILAPIFFLLCSARRSEVTKNWFLLSLLCRPALLFQRAFLRLLPVVKHRFDRSGVNERTRMN